MRKGVFIAGVAFLAIAAIVAGLLFLGPRRTCPTEVSVLLDFFANPNHVPLYAALGNGFFADEDVCVNIKVPADPSDPVKLVAAGTVDVALTPQINYLMARSAGLPLRAIGALIGTSLGGLLGLQENGVEQLSDLRGRRVGYALAPLEPTLWGTMLASVGVESDAYELLNVGYDTVISLLSGNVYAIGAFRNFEVVQVRLLGKEPVFFPQEDYGVPDTYEILLVTSQTCLERRSEALCRFIRGLARGIAFTRAQPEEAFRCFLQSHPDLDDELNRRAYDVTRPLYAEGACHDAEAKWEAMQAYLLENGLMERAFLVEDLYTAVCLPAEE
jgi:putative hydroxymethylpyrimidine transport system substrate-binding protein